MLHLQLYCPHFSTQLVVVAQGHRLRVLWRQTGSPQHGQVAEQP